MKESLFIGKIVFCRGPGKTQAVYISVAGRQKDLLVGLNKK